MLFTIKSLIFDIFSRKSINSQAQTVRILHTNEAWEKVLKHMNQTLTGYLNPMKVAKFCLTHSVPLVSFYTAENINKLVFWWLEEVKKDTCGMEWVKAERLFYTNTSLILQLGFKRYILVSKGCIGNEGEILWGSYYEVCFPFINPHLHNIFDKFLKIHVSSKTHLSKTRWICQCLKFVSIYITHTYVLSGGNKVSLGSWLFFCQKIIATIIGWYHNYWL